MIKLVGGALAATAIASATAYPVGRFASEHFFDREYAIFPAPRYGFPTAVAAGAGTALLARYALGNAVKVSHSNMNLGVGLIGVLIAGTTAGFLVGNVQGGWISGRKDCHDKYDDPEYCEGLGYR